MANESGNEDKRRREQPTQQLRMNSRARDGHTAELPVVSATPPGREDAGDAPTGSGAPSRSRSSRSGTDAPSAPPPTSTGRPERSGARKGRTATIVVLLAAGAVAVGVTIGALAGGWRPGWVAADPSPTGPATATVTVTATQTESPSPSETPSETETTPSDEPSFLAAVAAGGEGGDGWTAGEGFDGGSVADGISDRPVDTSNVSDPAPQDVYQSERFGDFRYIREGLEPGSSVILRLHFAEVWFEEEGQRVFDVSVNGDTALSDYDIFDSAGGRHIAIVEEIEAQADDDGRVVVEFSGDVDQAKLSALELLGVTS